MLNPELFATFLVITLVLVLTPGPIVTLLIATGAREGPRAALVTVLGTTLGNALLVGAIAVGLSWLVETSATLFEVLRFAGAAYLVWLGVQAWRRAGAAAPATPPPSRTHFWRGLLVALSNPKTTAFFAAFLPQFVDPGLPAAPQLAIMCAASVLIAGCLDAGWAVAAGLGRAWFLAPARAKLLGRASAALLVGGGVWLSLARRPA